MTTEIKFKQPTHYNGRNGNGIQTGIGITVLKSRIVINAINSKGVTEACFLNIPHEHMQEFIEMLKDQYMPKFFEIRHVELRQHINEGTVKESWLIGAGKISESPETWSIDGDCDNWDSSYLYESKQDYINDCHRLDIDTNIFNKEGVVI